MTLAFSQELVAIKAHLNFNATILDLTKRIHAMWVNNNENYKIKKIILDIVIIRLEIEAELNNLKRAKFTGYLNEGISTITQEIAELSQEQLLEYFRHQKHKLKEVTEKQEDYKASESASYGCDANGEKEPEEFRFKY